MGQPCCSIRDENAVYMNNIANPRKSYDIEQTNGITNIQCIKTIEGHNNKIACLIELSSGKIATGSYDKTIKIWNLDNYECEKTITEEGIVFCLLEFEPNILLSGTEKNTIQLWNINNYDYDAKLHSFEGHSLWVNNLVKCNSQKFASCSNDSEIRIWNYISKECENILKGHTNCILSMTMLKDGRLCSASADCTIKIWNLETNICEETLEGHNGIVKCVYGLSNGYIASGSNDKSIIIWNADCIVTRLEGHTESVRDICQINDNLIASSSFDRTIKIWDLNSGKCLNTLQGHTLNVIGIIYLKNSRHLISCSNDKTIKIWE